MESKKLTLAVSPHTNFNRETSQPMVLVVLALLPALVWGIYLFRLPALFLTVTCVAGCLVGEMIVQYLRKRDVLAVRDFSAVITGMLLAMVLTPTFSLPLAFLGSLFAIVVGKGVFGGLGFNIFNPALVGRAFLVASFPVAMGKWAKPILPKLAFLTDAVTSATPLTLHKFDHVSTSLKTLFLGFHGGCMGETSILLLLAGGIFLLLLRIIDWRIPVAICGTVAVIALVANFLSNGAAGGVLFHLFSGGIMIGAFFMATDFVTSPITPLGSIVFGIGIGLIIMIIRLFGGLAEGVMFAILFMNAFVPLINRHTRPRVLGAKGAKNA